MVSTEEHVAPTEWDRRLQEAVSLANVPTLLMVLVQLTGELRWLEEPYRPDRPQGISDNDTGGLPEPVQREIREAACAALLAWKHGRPPALAQPSHDLLVRMLSVAMGEEVPESYGPMMAAELEPVLADPAAKESAAPSLDVPAGFHVTIVGAGVSGLCAAVALQQAGVPYTIVEKNSTVGGTWWENRYPGAGVDTPNHLYSFSFAPHDWAHYFARRDELQGYLERIADEFDIRRHIRFETEARSATYDEFTQAWVVEASSAEGTHTLRSNILISAVGAFNKPKTPQLPGLETFRGRVIHTARWPDDLDLSGKRVAVIGNGASAMQVVPAIAPEVGELTVFQRSPQWAAPFEKFQAPVPDPVRFLLRAVPLYQRWYRLRLAWTFNDRLHAALQKDPSWPHSDRSLNAINEGHRRFLVRYIEEQLSGRDDLLAKSVPDYPPFGKRMLLDNGWYQALRRPNVALETTPIAEISPSAVVTEDGAEHTAEVLVLATGFDVVRFLSTIDVRGRDGRTLRQVWDDDDAKAYLGMTVPGFPNLFCLYGPNSQAGHGGSLIFFAEMQVRYLLDLLRQMAQGGWGAIEVREDVYEAYNRAVDEAHEQMVWTHPGMETYYRNARGRVVVNSPYQVVQYWHMTRTADLDDYVMPSAEALSRQVG